MSSATVGPPLEVEVRPPWPWRMPSRGGNLFRVHYGVLDRLVHVEGRPVVVRTWRRRDGTVVLRAAGAGREAHETAIERMRFALGLDEDLRDFYEAFRGDPLLGRAIRRRPWLRPRRTPWPWETLMIAIAKQLIESSRANEILRRMYARWGPRLTTADDVFLRDAPGAEVIEGVAPAELASMDLAPARALALIACAREAAAGRARLDDPASDARLLKIPEIGPWTVQCLGLFGRGEPDALPAGDLGYVKLIGRLTGIGRRATVEEVEAYFEPYAPFRGLAGTFMLSSYHGLVAKGPPLRLAA